MAIISCSHKNKNHKPRWIHLSLDVSWVTVLFYCIKPSSKSIPPPFPKLLISGIKAQHSPLCSLNWNQFIKETISPRIESPTVCALVFWPLSGWVERVASWWPCVMKGLDVRLQKCWLIYSWTLFRYGWWTLNTWLILNHSVSPQILFPPLIKPSLSSSRTRIDFPVNFAWQKKQTLILESRSSHTNQLIIASHASERLDARTESE